MRILQFLLKNAYSTMRNKVGWKRYMRGTIKHKSDTGNKTHTKRIEHLQKKIAYLLFLKKDVCINKYGLTFLCAETKRWTLLFINVQKVLYVRQQGKRSDITALCIMQEVGKWRGVLTDQDAQMDKTLTERKEEMSARLA